ncbi:MAG: hypothetical protein DRP79_01360 [Planctomycetota bacterium]|nr:MAG: hypothetical protein DRP79_01360 [Planctomycetota bacterium]
MSDDKFKVLVADDEPTIRELMQLLLEGDGHTVRTANDGVAALDALKEELFDFLLSDVKMPQVDGLELLRRAKALDPDLIVILMTGFGTIETAVEAIKRGAADFLTKPIRNVEQIPLIFRKARQFQSLQNEVKALRELNRLQDEFLALLSHELRTPVTNIQGCLEAMRDIFHDEISDDVRELLATAIQGTTSLTRIIENLLLLADLQNDRVVLDKQRADLAQLLDDVSREIIQSNKGKVKWSLEEDGGSVAANVDCKLLSRAIGNVLENAVKFNTDREGLCVTGRVSREDDIARISISNNGRPIAEENVDRIFRRFKQAEHYMTRSCDGMGLGLPIARTIVEKHGGEIKVSSGEEDGVTFEIDLPAVK